MRARALQTVLTALCVVAATSNPGLAQWRPGGILVGATGDLQAQDECRVAPDGQGGVYVSWRDARINSTTGLDIYLQHVLSDGRLDPRWPVSGLPVFASPGDEQDSQLAPDGAGGVIVVDVDGRNSSDDLYAQRIMPNGQPAPGWPSGGVPICTAPGTQAVVCVSADGTGGAYVTWDDVRTGIRHSRMTRVAGDGTIPAGWSSDGLLLPALNISTTTALLVPEPDGCFVTWEDPRGGTSLGFTMYALRLTSDGQVYPGWTTNGVPLQTVGTRVAVHRAASDGSGGAFVAWDDNRGGTPQGDPFYFDLYAQHILASGQLDARWGADGLAVCTAPNAQYDFDMASDGFGGAVLAWEDARDGYFQVYGLRLNVDATRASGWGGNGNRLSTSAITKFDPTVSYDLAGGLYAFWTQYNNVGPSRTYAQHVGPDGSLAASWDPTGLDLSMPLDGHDSSNEAVCADGYGGALIAFQEDDPALGTRIFAARVMADGPVPTLLSLADYDTGPGRVTLRWQATNAADIRGSVERSTDGATWKTLGAPQLEGTNLLIYDDLGVTPGRYWYRLAYSNGTLQEFSESVIVDVPAVTQLSLGGFRPNPAISNSAIAFSLPDAQPSRLEVVDVRGRIMLSREVGALGPGSHNVSLSDAGRLGPGVYWVRLVRPEATLTRKGVVAG